MIRRISFTENLFSIGLTVHAAAEFDPLFYTQSGGEFVSGILSVPDGEDEERGQGKTIQ